jgi:predicted secreted acid phosphatase
MKKTLMILSFSLLLNACSGVKENAQTISPSIVNDGKAWASLYQQRAAEYKALCFQAYNIARLRLNLAIAKHGKKPFAVITDIDETCLNHDLQDFKMEGF